MQVATSSFRDLPDMHPPADLGTCRFNEDRLDPGMDILEPVIECLLRDSLVVHLQQGRQDLFCYLAVNDLLLVQHQDVRDIHEDIRISDMAVCLHRGEEMHHLAVPLAREASQSYNIGSHPFTRFWYIRLLLVIL